MMSSWLPVNSAHSVESDGAPDSHIVVDIAEQQLLYVTTQAVMRYNISTALNGTGQASGSGKTPLGRHYIRAKIGAGLPESAVLVGRRFTGELYTSDLAKSNPKRDWILGRILWLSGLEPGVNRLGSVDTMRRYIYIHGTPTTEPLGIPLSHGCVRMHPRDVVELFDFVDVGTPVLIQ